ncbi:MAG: HAMP domain-containing histidine kinase [Firmicutes bacterium]|nr:HAMP domain-containing histidine kinase [Bacillota bacterium]
MGYFNMSILNDQLMKLSLQQSKVMADNIYSALDKSIPLGVDTVADFVKNKALFNEFQKYLFTQEYIRNIEIFDPYGNKLWSKLAYEGVKTENFDIVNDVRRTGMPEIKVLAVDPQSGVSKEIESFGVFDFRMLLEDRYLPIIRNGKTVGVIYISLQLQRASRLMKFFFLGNLSISLLFIFTAFIAIYIWSERAINRPFRYLLQAQEKLSEGDFDVQVDIELPANNELGIIANSFNRMARELKAYKEELDEKRRKLEVVNEQYRTLNENLEQEVEDKTRELKEFFSLITHDMKIPLAAIKGYTELLRKTKSGVLSEKQEKFVVGIESSAEHLLRMVRNMLDTVKYDAGRIYFFFEKFDLTNLVDEMEHRFHPLLKERNISFEKNIPEKCRFVFGDREKIGNVISNILSNATEHTPGGGKISLEARDKDDIVELVIEDNGPGIASEQLDSIFDKFQQVPGKESPSTSLGLGLFIVRKIMEGHGMKVWAVSDKGEGSRFHFTLHKFSGQDPYGTRQ